jgi:hypothetical protein
VNALPALSAIATAAVRRQFDATPEPEPVRAAPSSWRIGLAALLDRAARAVAPVGPRPAH